MTDAAASELVDEIVRFVRDGDAAAAVRCVERDGTPQEIAQRFDDVVRGLYWERKDLAAVVAVAHGGIRYCLAKIGESADRDGASFFGGKAKTLAANLASFTWPGWDETGIVPTADDLAEGLRAAELNLRLAVELGKPEERVQDAHWLLGAHLIAAGDAAGALEEFRQCSPETRPLFAGYELLARILLREEGADREFDELLTAMRDRGDKDSKFSEAQLATARRVFVAPS